MKRQSVIGGSHHSIFHFLPRSFSLFFLSLSLDRLLKSQYGDDDNSPQVEQCLRRKSMTDRSHPSP